jgi:CheY-like chemotaxis protein
MGSGCAEFKFEAAQYRPSCRHMSTRVHCTCRKATGHAAVALVLPPGTSLAESVPTECWPGERIGRRLNAHVRLSRTNSQSGVRMDSRSGFETRAPAAGEREGGQNVSNDVRGEIPPKARILVVDDSPDALTILRLFLLAQGFEVITAGGVAEALERVQEQLPDLIISDYVMPDRTGLDLCQSVRSNRQTRHIPIVLHTGTDLPATQTPLYDAVCAKPASLAQLARTVRSLLARSQAARAARH